MTIDEYLDQIDKLMRRVDACQEKREKLEARVFSPPSAFMTLQGSSGSKKAKGSRDDALARMIDAQKECEKAEAKCNAFIREFNSSLYDLKYWEGLVIEQIYIYNRSLDDNFWGLDEILKTDDRHQIAEKVREAKAHLEEILRGRGVDIS